MKALTRKVYESMRIKPELLGTAKNYQCLSLAGLVARLVWKKVPPLLRAEEAEQGENARGVAKGVAVHRQRQTPTKIRRRTPCKTHAKAIRSPAKE